MLYVDYNFEVKDGVITFDKELSGEEFLQRSGLVEGQMAMFSVVSGRLVLVCTDYVEENPAQTTLQFDQFYGIIDIMSVKKKEITREELEKSKRVFKSATPKYTLDWYIKWIASIFVLAAISMRGIDGFQFYDLSLSVLGVGLWLWVSILWQDRALILLNGVGLLFLLRNLFEVFFNV